MMKTRSPFGSFQNSRFFILLVIYIAYTLWFVSPFGFFGQLSGLAAGMPLEGRGYYTGTFAVETLSSLSPEGRRIKYLSLLFDIPYMVMTALVYEAMIVFGLRHFGKAQSKAVILLALPMIFLVVDFLEDSLLALTLASGSTVFGTLAGLFTPLKLFVFVIATLVSLGFVIAVLFSKIMRASKTGD